jgi:hypothetical protein
LCDHFKLECDPQRPWLWVCPDCLKRGVWKEEAEETKGSVRIIELDPPVRLPKGTYLFDDEGNFFIKGED